MKFSLKTFQKIIVINFVGRAMISKFFLIFLFCCIIPIIVRPQNVQNDDAFTAVTKPLLHLMSRTISFKKWRAHTDYSEQEAAFCSALLSRHLVTVVLSAPKQSPPRRCLFPKPPIHNVQGFSIVSSSVVVVRALLLSSNLYWWPKKKVACFAVLWKKRL